MMILGEERVQEGDIKSFSQLLKILLKMSVRWYIEQACN